jgi:hypothetical protein
MEAHEMSCEYVKESCSKCYEEVARKDRKIHDCIKTMLKIYKEKSANLDQLSTQVDELTLDINK